MSFQRLLTCKRLLAKPILAGKLVNISSILNGHLADATWSEQVDMTKHLTIMVKGALYSYTAADGWTYVEEGD